MTGDRLARAGRDRVRRHGPRHPHRRAARRWRASGSRAGPSASPTPTASPTSTSRRSSPSTASHGRLGDDDRGPAPYSQWGIAVLDDGRPGARASRRSRGSTTGSTAASSASSRRSSTTWTQTACSSASRCERLAADGQLRAFRHHGFWDCMDTYKDAVDAQRPLGRRARRPGRVWERRRREVRCPLARAGHRRARLRRRLARARRCSSAATGSSRSTAPPATGGPRRSALLGIDDRGRSRSRATSLDAELVRRALADHAGRRRLPPRRADDRRHRGRRRPAPTFEPTSAAPGRCSRPAGEHGVERVVVASSDKAYGAHDELPYREDFALQPTAPYEASRPPPT